MAQARVVKKVRKGKTQPIVDLSELKSVISAMLMPITNSINNLNEKVLFLVNAWNKREHSELDKRSFVHDLSPQSISADMIATDTLRLSKNYVSLKEQVSSYQKNLLQINEKLASMNKLMGSLVKRQSKKSIDSSDLFQQLENRRSVLKKENSGEIEEVEFKVDEPVMTLDTRPMQVLTLNGVNDYPQGSWLGDPDSPNARVRCPLRPEDLIYINTRCTTPEKMALALLDYLFSKETLSLSNISGKSKLGKKQLDPLMIYGIKCHLMHLFAITDKQWEKIKGNMDSKCRTAWRKRRSEYCISVEADLYPEDSQSFDSLADYTPSLETENDTERSKKRVIRTSQGDIVLSTDQILRLQDFHVLSGDNILPIISSDNEETETGITEQNHLEIVADESDTNRQDTISFVMEPMMEVLTESNPLTTGQELLN